MLSFFNENTWLLIAATFIFGSMIGSFLNVVILRIPPRLMHEWRCQCRDLLDLEDPGEEAPPGIILKRSHCPHCGYTLSAMENIPLLSYVVLRGRCSSCSKPISVRYPLVEFITALTFCTVVWKFGLSGQTLFALVFTAFLVALSGIDIDHKILPDDLTLPLLWLGLLLSLKPVFSDPVSSIAGAAAGYLVLWSIYQLFKLLTGKEGMGYGDFKLMAAIGAWLGWQYIPQVILVSSLVGAVIGIIMLIADRKRKGQHIPFGPYLALASWIALVWGDQITRTYLRFAG